MRKVYFTCFYMVLFLLSACVSTGKYNLLEAEAYRYQQEVKLLSKKATDYNELLNLANMKIDSLLAANDTLRIALGDLESRLEKMKEQNDNLLDIINAKDTEKDRVIAGLTVCKTDYENQLADNDSEILYLKDEIAKLQSQIDEIARDREKAISDMETTYDNLVSNLQSEIQDGQVQITQLQDKLSVNIVEKILFDTGKADIKPEGQAVLSRVVPVLKQLTGQQVRIEGHTDNVPIGRETQKIYATNWELSTARATNVVRFLVEEHGLDPKIISATGYSEFHPVGTNTTPEGKAKNRRIEIVLVPQDVDRVVQSKIYE